MIEFNLWIGIYINFVNFLDMSVLFVLVILCIDGCLGGVILIVVVG